MRPGSIFIKYGVEPIEANPDLTPEEQEKEVQEKLKDPETNIKFGTQYLTAIYNIYRDLLQSQDIDGRLLEEADQRLHFVDQSPSESYILDLALQGYNSGPYRILKILESFRGKSNIELKTITNKIRTKMGENLYSTVSSYSTSINMQVGGQVPQINRSGLIQGEGGPTSDSIPMQAEPNSFIVNAPAVQMAGGAKKLDSMVNAVQKQEQTSGFNQFGNPVTGTQDINVSNGEY